MRFSLLGQLTKKEKTLSRSEKVRITMRNVINHSLVKPASSDALLLDREAGSEAAARSVSSSSSFKEQPAGVEEKDSQKNIKYKA